MKTHLAVIGVNPEFAKNETHQHIFSILKGDYVP